MAVSVTCEAGRILGLAQTVDGNIQEAERGALTRSKAC